MAAVSAGTEILSALGAGEGAAYGFGVFNRRSAVPAHTSSYYQKPGLLNTGVICYNSIMFTVTSCAAGCGRPAVSGSTLCAVHLADPEAEVRRIGNYITNQKVVKDLNAQGLVFENFDFSHCQFYGCNFNGASFSACLFNGAVMRMAFFDFSSLLSCDFSKTDLQFLSFAGSTIKNCTFEGSELVHINYGGTVITGTIFDNSNLYNSRFIEADLSDTGFNNCNLKRANFIKARQEGVSFKASNSGEAVFEMEEMG
jgi:hypothetical protein